MSDIKYYVDEFKKVLPGRLVLKVWNSETRIASHHVNLNKISYAAFIKVFGEKFASKKTKVKRLTPAAPDFTKSVVSLKNLQNACLNLTSKETISLDIYDANEIAAALARLADKYNIKELKFF